MNKALAIHHFLKAQEALSRSGVILAGQNMEASDQYLNKANRLAGLDARGTPSRYWKSLNEFYMWTEGRSNRRAFLVGGLQNLERGISRLDQKLAMTATID